MGHPGGTTDRDRHLDRTHLPPSSPPGHARPVDPDRIRSDHDHTGQSGRVTETVTFPCSRPEVPIDYVPLFGDYTVACGPGAQASWTDHASTEVPIRRLTE